jgi:hypothetical protein
VADWSRNGFRAKMGEKKSWADTLENQRKERIKELGCLGFWAELKDLKKLGGRKPFQIYFNDWILNQRVLKISKPIFELVLK